MKKEEEEEGYPTLGINSTASIAVVPMKRQRQKIAAYALMYCTIV